MAFDGDVDDALTVFCSLTFLILVTICFEVGKEKLEHMVKSMALQPVVDTMFGELMVLGFIGLISFAVSKSGLLKRLSTVVYACDAEEQDDHTGRMLLETEKDECQGKITEAFETLHMMLFLTMVLFLCQVLMFVWLGFRELKRWSFAEKMSRTQSKTRPGESIVVTEYREAIEARKQPDGSIRRPNHWNPLEWRDWNIWWEIRYRYTYHRMRRNFIDPPYSSATNNHKVLPADFAMHHYLAERLGHQVAELVEVPVSTWLGLQIMLTCFLFVLIGIKNDIQKIIWIWLGIEYILLVLYCYLWRKFLWIKEMLGGHGALEDDPATLPVGSLTSQGFFSSSKPENEARLIESPLMADHNSGALFRNEQLNPIRERCALSKFIFGSNPPNKHQNLFWGLPHGAHYAEFAIRWILLNNSIYMAFFCYLFVPFIVSQEYAWDVSAAFFILCLTAPCMIMFVMTPLTLRLYVHITSIEMMKDKKLIKETVLRQKAQSTITMLKMVETMASHLRMCEMQADLNPEQAAQRLASLDPNDVQDIKKMFKMIDQDRSSYITLKELKAFLNSLGMTDSNPTQIMREIDTSGDGKISEEEFLQWMAVKTDHEHSSGHDARMITKIFQMFDTDGSGIIGASELAETLAKFGQTLDADEVGKMVTQFDEDGDGCVNQDEFVDLMKKSLDTRF